MRINTPEHFSLVFGRFFTWKNISHNFIRASSWTDVGMNIYPYIEVRDSRNVRTNTTVHTSLLCNNRPHLFPWKRRPNTEKKGWVGCPKRWIPSTSVGNRTLAVRYSHSFHWRVQWRTHTHSRGWMGNHGRRHFLLRGSDTPIENKTMWWRQSRRNVGFYINHDEVDLPRRFLWSIRRERFKPNTVF